MAYQALARKWRPRTFTEVVGQQHVVKALTHALQFDRMHHAYLFTGTRGVGKTTLGRILAKAVNCENRQGYDPCGECLICREVDEGRFIDLLEVDAASRTKVEDTRDLLENVQYAPSQGRYKIYLIDEVHMLSGHSFNALLKTLEEPPGHVKFLLATTDPQKIPVTVLSRCLQFNLKRLTPEQIRAQMETILTAESIAFEQNALRSLARAADGSMRDGLSLLDQAIVHGGGTVEDASVSAMLGTVSRAPVFGLLQAIAANDADRVLQLVAQLAERAPDYADILQQMLIALHHVALAQWSPDAVRHDEDVAQINELAHAITPEDVQLFYQIGLIGQRDLPLSPEQRGGFEMALLRMLAFRPALVDRTNTHNTAETRNPLPAGEGRARAGASHDSATLPKALGASGPHSNPFPTGKGFDSAALVDTLGHGLSATKSTHRPSVTPERPSREATVASNDTSDWSSMIKAMNLAGLTSQLANHCALQSIDASSVNLVLDPQFAQIRTAQLEANLAQALRDYLGKAIKLQINLAKPEQETPALQHQRGREERQKAAELEIDQDATVQALKDQFGARIIPGSTKPLD
jgi:DNA polymerase-3 subunit gamma/tau